MVYDVCKNILDSSDTVDLPSFLSMATSLGYKEFIDKKDVVDYIKSIFTFGINYEHIRKNAIMLRKLEIARKGQDAVRGIHAELSNITGNEPIGQIIAKIEAPILNMDFGTETSDDATIKLGDNVDSVIEQFENLDGKSIGIPSPYTRFNECIGGGRRPGYVYLKGARPKNGKTQDAIVDALHVSGKLNIPVLFLDTEMKNVDIISRAISSLSNLPFNEVETGKFKHNDFNKSKVYDAKKKLKSIPFSYRKISGKPFEEILSIIRKWLVQDVGLENGKAKPCLVIYDYFKLMDMSSLENLQEYQALGFQISALSDFCGKYEFPVSAYVQLNRDGVTKETSDVISQSDRLLWLCASFSILKRKTDAEILLDGPENGNVKLIPTADQRFGPGLGDGDWINMKVQFDRCIIEEGVSNREVKKNKKSDSGFNVNDDIESEEEDKFSDDDFYNPNFRDNELRKG